MIELEQVKSLTKPELVKYMLETSDHTWHELNKMPEEMLRDMVYYDMQFDEGEEESNITMGGSPLVF